MSNTHPYVQFFVSTILLAAINGFEPIFAAGQTIVSPIGLENREGSEVYNPGAIFPIINFPDSPSGFRIQQLYPKADFTSLGAGPYVISSIAFRPDVSVNQPVSAEYVYTINLSTTPKESVGSVFASNYGAGGATAVLQDAVQFQTDGLPPEGELPHDFDYVFTLKTSFTYDPQDGNLLVEWISPTNARFEPTWQDGMELSNQSRTVLSFGAGEQTGIVTDAFSITQFTIIPEPSSVVLLGSTLR